jgi:transcriptional regulator with PAS, ATPase and Fis domain
VAASELPALILGESGTGKELFARALHQRSPRAQGPFVALNCAALPDHLLESELFGYEKGAFTGALTRKLGLLEVADRGVLFLDEVGDLTPAVQVKLLRALETKEFLHLGGTRPVRTDIRIVSATHRDLDALGEAGTFRRDLYYRLNGVTLELPPLRERPGDVLALAEHFLHANRVKKQLSERAALRLQEYAWPGNVRELQMVVLGAAVMAPGERIELEDLPLAVQGKRRGGGGAAAAAGAGAAPTPAGADAFADGLTLAEVEQAHIKRVLEKVGGHRGRAAKMLGVDVRTLYNKLGSSRPREAQEGES